MFRSNDLGFARKQFDSISDSDISKKYASKEAFYSPPTSWLSREFSYYFIEDKLARLRGFYPYQRNINETRQAYEA